MYYRRRRSVGRRFYLPQYDGGSRPGRSASLYLPRSVDDPRPVKRLRRITFRLPPRPLYPGWKGPRFQRHKDGRYTRKLYFGKPRQPHCFARRNALTGRVSVRAQHAAARKVFQGRCAGARGITRSDLMQGYGGRIVSKKKHAIGRKYHHLNALDVWVRAARRLGYFSPGKGMQQHLPRRSAPAGSKEAAQYRHLRQTYEQMRGLVPTVRMVRRPKKRAAARRPRVGPAASTRTVLRRSVRLARRRS